MSPAERPGRTRNGKGKFTRAIDTIDRNRRAAELITQGWTYPQVTEHLGYSDKGTCWKAVQLVRREAAQLDGTSEELRRQQLAEMQELRKRLWDTINNPPPAISRTGKIVTDDDGEPVPDAVAVAAAQALLVRVSERVARIRGTDAPRRSVTLTGTVQQGREGHRARPPGPRHRRRGIRREERRPGCRPGRPPAGRGHVRRRRRRTEAAHRGQGRRRRRVASPRDPGLSMDSMRALAAPVLAIAEAVAPLRLDRPAFQFTRANVVNDIQVAFALAIAGQLAELTGLRSAEHVAGVSAGRKQAEAEQRNWPRRGGRRHRRARLSRCSWRGHRARGAATVTACRP